MANAKLDQTRWPPEEIRRAVDAAGVGLWSWNVDTDEIVLDSRGHELWNVSETSALSFELLSEKIHPADRDRVRAAFTATRAILGAYEIDFRTLIDDEVRWISARGRGSDEGIRRRRMVGIFLDVTGRKHTEESSELLAGEMSHRVKNLLTIASGLTNITSRSSDSVEDMAKQLTTRLAALGRAHDLVRPLPGGQGKAALLGDLLTILLAPYDEQGAFEGRIRVAVPRLGVGEAAAAGLAMVLHELATNSLKYGALSGDCGLLDVSGQVVGEDVKIVWTEQGGPEVKAPTGEPGYGSKLVQQMIAGQLGGSVDYDWAKSGAVVTILIKASMLAE
ncbi:two-component sensor histidine kinase [Cereibacter changlensis]|uniref:histidine kinase n=1 Tax=Cereibacter changlensis TaxID=402884 RepID=A0A2W7QCW5_9RHOB|nr:sensor histidine kinase [Cereibacter changlensis]PZX46051.1 two-component sensor histidine kinase [Cereibacter changlensis]